MGLQYRSIRAAATALLVAAAIGAGGMTGMTSALAADPATVALAGTVTGTDHAPVAGVHLMITVEHPADGAVAAVQAITAADGSFTADLFAWGTADAPAKLTITADDEIQLVDETCTTTVDVVLNDVRLVNLADAAPVLLELTATTTPVEGICGTTGTPPDDNPGGGLPGLTPPPTDILAAPLARPADRLGPALTIGFVIGLLTAAALLLQRPGARRRD